VALISASLNLTGTRTNHDGDVITLINNQGSNPVSGTFLNLPEGSRVTVNGVNYLLSYHGGDGNDVTLTDSTPPVAANDNYNASENLTLTQNAAHGVLANDTGSSLSVFSVDGSTTSVSNSVSTGHGTLTLNADGSFTYVPDHDFVGVDDATFYVATDGIQQSNQATLQFVVAPGMLTTNGINFAASAMTDTGSIHVAHFDDTAGGEADEYTATVNWGDGTTTGSDVVSDSAGGWIVQGNHTYASAGVYPVSVTIDSNVGASITATSSATVSLVNGGISLVPSADLPLEPGGPFNVALAQFSDSWAGVNLAAVTATVDWGDGTALQAAAFKVTSASGVHPATGIISGGHAYAATGTYAVTVTVEDGAGNTVHTSFNADVAPLQYVVPGTAGQNATVTITKNTPGLPYYDNQLVVFQADAPTGAVNGILPGDSRYSSTVFNDPGTTGLFNTNTPNGTSYTVQTTAGDTVGFAMVQNNTLAHAEANNPDDLPSGVPYTFFIASAANPDSFPHFRRVNNADGSVSYEIGMN
jgi:hypothetical protein